jgi:hypothetical protein
MKSLNALRVRRAAAAVLGVAGVCAVLIGCAGDDAPTTAPERARGPIEGSGAFPSYQPPTGATSAKYTPTPDIAPGDVNGDGFHDVVVVDRAGNRLRVHLGTGPDTFQEAAPVPVNNPVNVASGDMNGDGHVDLAVYSPTGRTVSIFAGNGAGGFALVAAAASPQDGLALTRIDVDHNGQDDTFLTTAQANVVVRVADAAGNYALSVITGPESTLPADTAGAIRGDLGTYAASASDCGDEPDCEANSQGEGIQECLRAAGCRLHKCIWAACVLYTDKWWKWPRAVAAAAACEAVYVLEAAACLPTQIISSAQGAVDSRTTGGGTTVSTKSDVVVTRLFPGGAGSAEFRYFVAGGRLQLELTLVDADGGTTTEVHDVDAYSAPVTVTDDGTTVLLADRNGVSLGLDAAGQKLLAAPVVSSLYAAETSAARDPIVIPLGRCVLVVGYSPDEYPGCLVAVLACDRDGDFKPDWCRMLVKCPGEPVRISDCTSQVQN